jgi:uncharacterized membrane protein
MKKTSVQIAALVALTFFWFLMLRIVLPYSSGRTDIDFLLTKQPYLHLEHYMGAFYLHIFSSLWLLASGLTQFSANILKNKANLHRWVGRIYVVIILFISGPAAIVMSYYANGGPFSRLSFLTLSIFWWYATLRSYLAIRGGNIRAHGDWMIRSYALTLSAVTLRIMQFGFTFTDIHPFVSYQIIAWPSWLLNWAIAEWMIRQKYSLKVLSTTTS